MGIHSIQIDDLFLDGSDFLDVSDRDVATVESTDQRNVVIHKIAGRSQATLEEQQVRFELRCFEGLFEFPVGVTLRITRTTT